jgi:hypothetical protein
LIPLIEIFGSVPGQDRGFVEGLAMKRASKVAELMHFLPQLRDLQSELLLLRPCMGIAKHFFGRRTCQPIYVEKAAMLFDKELCGAIEDIVKGSQIYTLMIFFPHTQVSLQLYLVLSCKKGSKFTTLVTILNVFKSLFDLLIINNSYEVT